MIVSSEDNSPPTEPLLDYVTELNTRRLLFDELRALLYDYGYRANSVIFAVFMVAPISEIRNHLQTVRDSAHPHAGSHPAMYASVVCAWAGIRAYLAKTRSPEAAPLRPRPTLPPCLMLNDVGIPSHSRLVIRREISDRIKDRDGHFCVFSGASDPQAAYVFPFATSKERDLQGLSVLLDAFWGPEKSMVWRRAYEDPILTQSAKNGISMNHQLHFWFDHARFALKPLRETPEGIIVQWHWLKRSTLRPLTEISPSCDSQEILPYAGLMEGGWGDNLAHRPSGVAIRTGQTFLFRAHEMMPSWDLLEMQWDLLRVAAICGAAEVTDEYYDWKDPPDWRGYEVVYEE